jgi:hypothetical protein
METTLITTQASIELKPQRKAKSGRTLKAVFGKWHGEALITEAGRLCPRKEFGIVTQTKGVQLATRYDEAVQEWTTLGMAKMSHESTELSAGKRSLVKMFHDPKNGRLTIVTAPANKDSKLVKQMKDAGCTDAQIEAVLAKR